MSSGRGEHRSVEELECEEDEEDDGEEEAYSDEDEVEDEEASECSPGRASRPQQAPQGALLVSDRSPEKEDSIHWLFMLAVAIGAIVTVHFLYLCLMWAVMTY